MARASVIGNKENYFFTKENRRKLNANLALSLVLKNLAIRSSSAPGALCVSLFLALSSCNWKIGSKQRNTNEIMLLAQPDPFSRNPIREKCEALATLTSLKARLWESRGPLLTRFEGSHPRSPCRRSHVSTTHRGTNPEWCHGFAHHPQCVLQVGC